jgi:putative hemolysin
MTSIALEILLILVLIIANGIFAGSEIAVVSARKVRLEQAARQGDKKSLAALKLANSPNNFLSAVQIGITLIGILSGAVGGATLASRLRLFFDEIPVLDPYSEVLSVAIIVSIITYLSLVIGELVPKRVALGNPEMIARNIARPMSWLARLTAPFVYLLGVSTDAMLKLLGIEAVEEQPMTQEEIKVLIEQGTRAGMFEVAEQEMVSRVFRLGDRSVRSIMTPRVEIVWIDADSPLEEIQQEMLDSPYSRFPVGESSLDSCIGILAVKDFWAARQATDFDIRSILQPALFVPETTPALDVLARFRQSSMHMALVTDEYGVIEGLLTLNNLIEAIVGNLPNQDDTSEPQVLQREDGSWLLDGLLSIDELKETLELERVPREEEGYYHTLGGLVITLFGHIPRSGDYFEAEGMRFEVVDMDGNRVDKVLVSRVEGEEETTKAQRRSR